MCRIVYLSLGRMIGQQKHYFKYQFNASESPLIGAIRAYQASSGLQEHATGMPGSRSGRITCIVDSTIAMGDIRTSPGLLQAQYVDLSNV